jgi:hypothetical protein
MTSKRSGKGGGRVTPKGTHPPDKRPKIAHHEEVERAHSTSSGGEVDHGGGTRGNAQHEASPRSQGRTGPRGNR